MTWSGAQVPAAPFWSILLAGAVIGILAMRIIKSTRPRTMGIVGLVVALLVPVAARALPTLLTFTNGTVADANQVNADFALLNTVLVNGGSQISFGKTKTSQNQIGSASFGGSTDYALGYPDVKRRCETSVGSPTAHVCAADEIVRLAQIGAISTTTQPGWIATGLPTGSAGTTTGDCVGWTSTSSSASGTLWGQGPSVEPCSNSHPLLCCD
jgi:hypothetical protein